MRDRRHRPMTHALHDDSYGPQLWHPCSVAVVVKWRRGGPIPTMAVIKNSSR